MVIQYGHFEIGFILCTTLTDVDWLLLRLSDMRQLALELLSDKLYPANYEISL